MTCGAWHSRSACAAAARTRCQMVAWSRAEVPRPRTPRADALRGSLNGLAGACDLRILAPEAVAGTYLVRRILPASKASSAPPPMARLLLAPGDRRLCQRPKLSQLGDSQEAPIYRRYWLLVAIGGCSPRQKAANAAALPGAEGILLASANALLVGSGGIAAAPA